MVYNSSMNFFQRLKQKIWRLFYPIFPQIEHRLLFLHEKKRQKYRVGWLAPHHTVAGMKKHLAKEWGFGNHFVAWEDSDQILSWRKLTSFNEQYHLRLYSDGEIRGHYEYTPEAAPIRHLMSTMQKAKTHDFLNFLGTFVTTKKHLSKVKPDMTVNQDSEVTFE